jgi:hypothetical protein
VAEAQQPLEAPAEELEAPAEDNDAPKSSTADGH